MFCVMKETVLRGLRFCIPVLGIVWFSVEVSASLEARQEDVERSWKVPVVSGMREAAEDISQGRKAVLTLCSVPVVGRWFSYEHTALVFEHQHPQRRGINLLMMHFGETKNAEEGRPTILGRNDTLIKVCGSVRVRLDEREETVPPVYTRHVSFQVEHDRAMQVLERAEHERELSYALLGGMSFWAKGLHAPWASDVYNCCTWVDACLERAGVRTGFNHSWGLKRASNLRKACQALEWPEHEKVVHAPVLHRGHGNGVLMEAERDE